MAEPSQTPAGEPAAAARDHETARLLRQKDPDGLTRLLTDHTGRVRSALRREFAKVLDTLEIDEALSQASHRIWNAGERCDADRAELGAWFFVIARNCARRLLDGKRRRATVSLIDDPDSLAASAPAPGDAGAAARRAISQAVHGCIQRLPPQQRAVILADLAAGGTADTDGLMRELSTTRNSVYVARANGRRALRTAMQAMEDAQMLDRSILGAEP